MVNKRMIIFTIVQFYIKVCVLLVGKQPTIEVCRVTNSRRLFLVNDGIVIFMIFTGL